MPPRVLTVARWYPSHDSPGSGTFVADLVAATRDAGAEHVVASFETIRATRHVPRPDERRAATVRAIAARLDPAAVLAVPRRAGVPPVPVARLPVVPFHGDDTADGRVRALLDALAPFVDRLLETWRPDVIHAHTGLPDGVAAAQIGWRLGIPVVVSEHASTIDEQLAEASARERYAELLAPDVRLVAVSPALRARLATALGGQEEAIGILPNPVAVDGFVASPDRPDAPVDRDPNELLWVGSRADHKGIEVLLRAVAILHAARPEIRLRLVGRPRLPDEDDHWVALAATLGIADAVTLEPWAARDVVAAAMRHASVFVHPSPAETFGVVAAEAIVAGLPVATRRSGGVPWIVETSGGFGAIADGDDPEALARAVERLLTEPLPVDARAARDRVIGAFGPAAVARGALELYAASGDVPATPAATGHAGQMPSRTAATLPRIVVGIERAPTLRAIEAVPTALRASLTVLTAAGDPRASDLGVADLAEPDLDVAHRAALAALDADRAPRGMVGRLTARLAGRDRAAHPAAAKAELAARRHEFRQDALAAALRTILGEVAGPPREVIALDLGGAAAVLDVPDLARLAPHGLRHLVDAWTGDDEAPSIAAPTP